ncbi:MAG: PQQ-binding-like beta-propeller repeat protein [Acidobacteria bacterium]|nr:PQQ-binding-like beta-propeller repeat protein [Acidobacteriota bacterium]
MPLCLAWLAVSTALLSQEGRELFEKHCASCHRAGSDTRAPLPNALRLLSKDAILASLESGSMKAQGSALARAERLAIANTLSGVVGSDEQPETGACPAPAGPPKDLDGWNGWGVDPSNTRSVSARIAALGRDQVARLKLKWAFGYPGQTTAAAQPTLVGGRLFLGSMNGTVYSLDAKTGCRYWTFKAPATVRTAITVAPAGNGSHVLYFGDTKASVYALDAQTGSLVWKTQVETHPYSRITGAPLLAQGRLYVPVSSVEEVPSQNPKYECCTFRGSLVALDVKDGKQLWKTHTIPDPPGPTVKNSAGTQMWGPSGAAVWSAPTLDLKRKAVYIATGNNYTNPEETHSDAILAIDMETGGVRWSAQMTPKDNWNMSCINPNKASCPENPGQDLDFGSSPILRTVGGRDLLVVGQKSGIVHALDPGKMGKIVWQTRIGRGGALGGVEWGSAADDEKVYVALSDYAGGRAAEGGMFALNLATGEKVWHTPAPAPACKGKAGCSAAQMAAVTLMPGAVFSGSMDGHLRAYDTNDGAVLWDFDTLQEFQTVNGVKARGGSMSAGGPAIVGGMLYVNSGYGALAGMAGNVLLAFGVD